MESRLANAVLRADTDGEATGIEYDTYRFGRAKQRFRGPQPDTSRPYVAVIGSTETYGRDAAHPYPALLSERLGFTFANWGTPGAGPGFFLKDPVILEACSNAKVCVIVFMDAHAMSNRLFQVYQRRNARFKGPSEMMSALYPEISFDQFRFVKNALSRLNATSADRFKVVELEMRQAYIARMRELLEAIETRKVLLWFSRRDPDAASCDMTRKDLGTPPVFVDRKMVERIGEYADEYIEVVMRDGGDAVLTGGPPSEAMHTMVADALEPTMRKLLKL